jgi:hypothetical protein
MDFFTQVYWALEIGPADQERFQSALRKLILANVTSLLLTDLPEHKRRSLYDLVRKQKTDPESIKAWLEANSISSDQVFIEKINAVIQGSVNDFFNALTHGLDEDKKAKLLTLAKSRG